MTNPTTSSQRLHESLGDIIAAAEPGERLPSEPKLARQLGVSRASLREAMRTFETQGLLHRRQGSGTYVVHPTHVFESGLEVLESIETMARRIGLPVSMGDLVVEERFATEQEAKMLGLTTVSKVTHLSRIILADERPIAYLVDIVPDDVLSKSELKTGFSGSVLDLLLRRESPTIASSRSEINAVTASSGVARALGIQRGDVLLMFEANLYTTKGQVVDWSTSYFLPGYFRFYIVRRVVQIGKSNNVA